MQSIVKLEIWDWDLVRLVSELKHATKYPWREMRRDATTFHIQSMEDFKLINYRAAVLEKNGLFTWVCSCLSAETISRR